MGLNPDAILEQNNPSLSDGNPPPHCLGHWSATQKGEGYIRQVKQEAGDTIICEMPNDLSRTPGTVLYLHASIRIHLEGFKS